MRYMFHLSPLKTSLLRSMCHIYAFRIRKCGDLKDLEQGTQIHCQIRKAGLAGYVYLGNLLVQMYGKCGALASAEFVFSEIIDRNVFSWCLMIGIYIQEGENSNARQRFHQMQQENVIPDTVTCISILSACAKMKWLPMGKSIHTYMACLSSNCDVIMGTALVNMYGKCGNLECSREMFENMVERNVISWNAMISAYALNNHYREALGMLHQMLMEGLTPNSVTFISVLDACEGLGSLFNGKIVHACIVYHEDRLDVVVRNALVNMYGKCGSLNEAQKVFDEMTMHNVSSWNTIIAAHGQHGNGHDVLNLVEKMRFNGIIPDSVTYFSLLSACSHAALVEEGCHYFTVMKNNCCIATVVEHYNCMIDLLGRAGMLDNVEGLMKAMPMSPDLKSWITLLGACRMHFDMQRAQQIAEHLLSLNVENRTPYLFLANMLTTVDITE